MTPANKPNSKVSVFKPPNFFIVGAARSGTTTLWWCLKQNPQVYMPPDLLSKEPAFFSFKNRNMRPEDYFNLFRNAQSYHRRIGEASTAYLTDMTAAAKIKHFNPEAKILILLRDPSERAYSLYCWMVREGYEYASTFVNALRLEKKRIHKRIPNFWEPEYFWNYMYFHSGLYYRQVRRYLTLFGSNVKVIKFDDFVTRFETTYGSICDFLEVDTNEVKPIAQNVAHKVLNPVIQFSLRKLNNCLVLFRRKILKTAIETKMSRDRLLRLSLIKKTPPQMDPFVKTELLKRYRVNIIKLSELTAIDLFKWTSSR